MPAREDLTQVEKDKLEIDPDIDFHEIAEMPFEAITKSLFGMFKWSGVYHQLQPGYFMIRISLPGGRLTSAQLRRCGEVAATYGQGQLCITTRQTLQYHWIRQKDICKVIEGVREVGLKTRNACGDVCRNVVSCSLQGVCPHEVGDVHDVLEAIATDDVIQSQKRNLPRKHKIAVSGCTSECAQGVMNCQGWYPVMRDGERGWAYSAGGGLGGLPHMARPIFKWVPESLVLPVTRAGVEIHDRQGNRRLRKLARLKIIVAEQGARQFGEMLLDVMRADGVEGLDRIEFADDEALDLAPFPFPGQSVIRQKRKGFNAVRITIPRSEFSSAEATRFADWADTHGEGVLTLTNRQNLEIHDVADTQVGTLLSQIEEAGYAMDGLEHMPDVVSCVGTTLCNLAVADTPNTYHRLINAIEAKRDFWRQVGPLRINMNGCPNACGQHWIADIGLRGGRIRHTTGSEEVFAIHVGGRLDGPGHIAEFVRDVAATDVVDAIFDMVAVYLENRAVDTETFGQYVRRVGVDALRQLTEADTAARPHEPINIRNLRLEPAIKQAFEDAKEQS